MNCIFCKIRDGIIPSEKIYENEDYFVIKDLNPVAKVHLLIITKLHVRNILEVEATVLGKLQETINEVAQITGLKERGFRLITNIGKEGGQEIEHLHFHFLGGEQLKGLVK